MRLRNFLILLRHARVMTFDEGEALIEKGSEEGKVFYIRKGLVRSYYKNENLDEITFQLFPESSFFGNLQAVVMNEPSRFTYHALEKTKVYAVDFHSFRKEIAKQASKLDMDRNFLFQKVMKQLYTRIESFVLLSPEERYQKYVKDYPNVVNRAPDKYIAHVLGITPVSLSRIRSRIASKSA